MQSLSVVTWLADEPVVASPCISVCVMNSALGYCIGCHRTLDEIADWINLDSTQRRSVLDAVSVRKKAIDEKR